LSHTKVTKIVAGIMNEEIFHGENNSTTNRRTRRVVKIPAKMEEIPSFFNTIQWSVHSRSLYGFHL